MNVNVYIFRHGFLPDQSLVPKLMSKRSIRQSTMEDDDDEDD